MKAWDYDAVVYDGCVYCSECLPLNLDSDSAGVEPIFSYDEWGYEPVCDVCFKAHDYVTVIPYNEGSDTGTTQ